MYETPIYKEGEPIGLHHILDGWLKDRGLPVMVFYNSEALDAPREGRWMLTGETALTAEIYGQRVIGWSAEFDLNAADPRFFDKLEAEILKAEDCEVDL